MYLHFKIEILIRNRLESGKYNSKKTTYYTFSQNSSMNVCPESYKECSNTEKKGMKEKKQRLSDKGHCCVSAPVSVTDILSLETPCPVSHIELQFLGGNQT